MILHDHQRRWYELRLYYFCMDLYHIRLDLRDAIFGIEAIAQIGNFDTKMVKNIAVKMLGDPHYLPQEDELIILAGLNGVKSRDIAEYTGQTQNTINRKIRQKTEKFISYPLLTVAEDEKVKEFLDQLDIFRKAGL